jgi:hypothetical protein
MLNSLPRLRHNWKGTTLPDTVILLRVAYYQHHRAKGGVLIIHTKCFHLCGHVPHLQNVPPPSTAATEKSPMKEPTISEATHHIPFLITLPISLLNLQFHIPNLDSSVVVLYVMNIELVLSIMWRMYSYLLDQCVQRNSSYK